VPILDALNITKETCGNEVYSKALCKVHDAIREGESMADPLRATKVCDAIVVNMVDVGEETGDLDKMLIKVADNYDSDVDVLVGSLISILEPVMVVVLGLIVGFIVVAAVRADDLADSDGLVASKEVIARARAGARKMASPLQRVGFLERS
jgi:type IV pilus assembly protein PilC